MTLDDETIPPYVAEAVLRDEPVKRRQPRNMIDEKDRRLEQIADDIAGCRSELAHLEREYARVQAWQPDFYDADPAHRERVTVDARLFPSAGTDEVEQWRPREDSLRRSMVDVPTGGRT